MLKFGALARTFDQRRSKAELINKKGAAVEGSLWLPATIFCLAIQLEADLLKFIGYTSN